MPVGVNGPVGPRAIFQARTRQLTPQVFLKEEQFLRYLLSLSALAFMLAGSGAFAVADPVTTGPQAATISTASATSSSSVPVESGAPVTSPDVVEWTANVIRQQRAHSGSTAGEHHGLARLANRILAHTTSIARSLTRNALRFLGTPYVFGGTSGAGFDCSGFVQHVFALMGVSLPRTADAQYYAERAPTGGVQAGDLVFFQTYEAGPSHVGIYIGGGKFVHASSSHGVMVSALSDSYWSARYLGAKRVLASR